jgi:hypothetical protein
MKRELFALVIWMLLWTTAGDPSYDLIPNQESPDIYFENRGYATILTTTWTIIVYVPLQMTVSENTDLERFSHYSDRTCFRLTVKDLTACSYFCYTMKRRLQQIRIRYSPEFSRKIELFLSMIIFRKLW